MLIYGSTAIKHWFPDFREPKDIDYISKEPFKNSHLVEYYWIEEFQYLLDNNIDSKYIDPDLIYTIKLSHASWDIRFDKHIKDILFLRDKGCQLNMKFYKMLYKRWEIIHGKKKVNFSGTNDEFFTQKVTRAIPHDELHELVAFYNRPLHESIRINQDKPKPSFELFNQLSHSDQLKCALEEIWVIALERYILPKQYSLKRAKYTAMKDLITKMSKGWFNIFLIDNFDHLIYSDNGQIESKLENIRGIYEQK